jgi:hypothetical protein
MADGDFIVLSDYSNLSSGAIKGRQGRERQDGTRGKARMTIEIQSEPLVVNFDEIQLGAGPAAAIAEVMKERIGGVQETVKDSTLYTRTRQELAYDAGKPWAQKRFGGGRIGNMAPKSGEARYLNHSGRLRESVVATENKTEKGWTVNVAANRLDPSTSRNAAEFANITDAFNRFVKPETIWNDPKVVAAIDASFQEHIVEAWKAGQGGRARAFEAFLSGFRQGSGFSLGGKVQSFFFG